MINHPQRGLPARAQSHWLLVTSSGPGLAAQLAEGLSVLGGQGIRHSEPKLLSIWSQGWAFRMGGGRRTPASSCLLN